MSVNQASQERPLHSHLGASSAERWMNCHGSVALLRELKIEVPTDEPEWRALGTVAHAAIDLLLRSGQDAWEIIGEKPCKEWPEVAVDAEMAQAIQVYLDECRPLMDGADRVFIEEGIEAPEIHPEFYGTTDFAAVRGDTLYVRDYKHGEGIVVEAEWNPQFIYYAYGVLRLCPDVKYVNIGVVQPRGFHHLGPVRIWDSHRMPEMASDEADYLLTADDIRAFVLNEIKPAMDLTAVDHDLDAGPWCRFCPAKLVCPLMTSLFGAAATYDKNEIIKLSDESVGRSYGKVQAVKFYINALEQEAYNRLNVGREVPGVKLVHKKANRIWGADAETVIKAKFGADAVKPAELKSPAEIEKLGPEAKALVKEHAYTPSSGLTVALESDKRVAVKVQTTTEAFPGAAAFAEGDGS